MNPLPNSVGVLGMTLPPPKGSCLKRQKVGRNEPCPCRSGKKHKKCCLLNGLATAFEALPSWILNSRKKLLLFEKYVSSVFGLPYLLGRLTDPRVDPEIPFFPVVNSLFHAGVLRIPSINALEGDLKEADFQKLIGLKPRQGIKAFSAEVLTNVLDKIDGNEIRHAIEDVFWKAERNKTFREGSYGALRCVAIDGWEPFSSFHRHCPHCHVRKVKVKRQSGEVEVVEQYYHKYVVALLVGSTIDVVLGLEPIRNGQARLEAGEQHVDGAEGEQPAATRLLESLHKTYGSIIDAFIFDSLYPNGPMLTKLQQLNYGAFIVMKKENNEPLKEALTLWQDELPCKIISDPKTGERIEFWDVPDLETLDTFKGKIRVLRAVVTRPGTTKIKRTWCIAIIGARARKISLITALKITRSRWHIENTAFNQWIKHWNLGHVFRHTPNATLAALLLFSLAFNLMQLFVYRRLKRDRRPKDPTDTIRHIVEVMLRDVATLPEPFPWDAFLDSS